VSSVMANAFLMPSPKLRLTPHEHERLRIVSYQRRKEAGMRNPGRAGLTADRLGDALLWEPAPAANMKSPQDADK